MKVQLGKFWLLTGSWQKRSDPVVHLALDLERGPEAVHSIVWLVIAQGRKGKEIVVGNNILQKVWVFINVIWRTIRGGSGLIG